MVVVARGLVLAATFLTTARAAPTGRGTNSPSPIPSGTVSSTSGTVSATSNEPLSDAPSAVPSAAASPTNTTTVATNSTSSPDFNVLAVNLGWPYGESKLRGVNLGGWLVLEPWITPSLFDATGNDAIIDEWTFGQLQDRGRAMSALRKHWDTWITEDDFAQIAAAGLNHVRIPIGFWAYDVSGGEPYLQGQAEYLDKAIGWARNHNIKVMIDLHGAPGSQNGFDNSGRRGSTDFPNDPNNARRAKNIIGRLSLKYSDPSYWQVVTSVALLNEPAGFLGGNMLDYTKQYWKDSYGAARYPWAGQGRNDKSGLLLVISDAFEPLSSWNGFMHEPQYESVAIDHHHYQVFNDDLVAQDYNAHIRTICDQAGPWSQSPLWLMIGEWSLATTDCAKYLNGRGVGVRYDGTYPGSRHVGNCNVKTGDGSTFSSEYKEFLRKFYDIQTQTMENFGTGWIFWTWKNEEAAEWSYQKGVQEGWIPRNPADHKYQWADVCNA